MSPKDHKLMEQIFDEVESVNPFEQPLTDDEIEQINFALIMYTSFQDEIQQRFTNNNWCFLAPPTNFSFQQH